MKKTPSAKKLLVSTQRIRELQAERLAGVVGGASIDLCDLNNTTADTVCGNKCTTTNQNSCGVSDTSALM
jgi:hypothetical protein